MAKAKAKPAKQTGRKAAPKSPKARPTFEGHPIDTDSDLFVEAIGLGRNILVISCRSYKDRKALDLRTFYLRNDEEYKPTGKGVWIPADVVERLLDVLAEHRDAIAKALDL